MELDEIKIYILVLTHFEYIMFKAMFSCYSNVEVVRDEFEVFMNKYPDVECIVSPANSYGIMNGGYDAAILNYLGWSFEKQVQNFIFKNYYGEQLVGTSFLIDAPKNKKFIHTPTMILPEKILDHKVVYSAMRSTLMCALDNNIKSIVIPPFGAGTGLVPIDIVCQQMEYAYRQMINAVNRKYIYYDELVSGDFK